MKQIVILSLPYPPSVNTYWRHAARRTYVSKKGVEFKRTVSEYVAEHNIQKMGDADLEVTIILRPRSKNYMDLDNCCKAVLDSCQDAGVFDDDKQIWKLTVLRAEIVKGGGCTVLITKREAEEDGKQRTNWNSAQQQKLEVG